MVPERNRFNIAFVLLAVVLPLVCGCISTENPSSLKNASIEQQAHDNATDLDKINAVVTIGPLAEFANAIGGDRVSVSVLVPPGAEPHTFEPTPSDMMKIADADIYIKNGAGLEFWMDRILQANPQMLIIDSSEGIDFVSEDTDSEKDGQIQDIAGSAVDPHIWLSTKNAVIQVSNICDGLVQTDPAGEDEFIKNRDLYIDRLRSLDSDINRSLEGSRRRTFVVHHPAWTYFARDYGLTQIPIMENDREPGPRYLAAVVERARAEGISVIFVEPEFNQKAAEVLAKELNSSVVYIDPLAGNYLESLKYSAERIAESMK